MSLTQALTTALSGLNATQSGLSLVAGNIANAQTPGYVRETAVLTEQGLGTTGTSVRVSEVSRVLDEFVQSQLRTESAGAGYADVRSNLYSQLQSVYGTPGSANSLETIYNNFTTALQALTTSPDNRSAQIAVTDAAQSVAETLNSSSNSIQALREEAEVGIGSDINAANNALQQIANLNQRIAASPQNDSSTAALLDQRDTYIDQLSKMMDIRIVKADNNQVSVFTTSGMQLVGSQAGTLTFDAQGTMTPQAKWSSNSSQRTVGTITLTTPNGAKIDMITSNAIRSGEIAGYLSMRDQALTQAQDQLDQFAAAISSALSDQRTAGTAVTVGAQNGFDVDSTPLQSGNPIDVTYTTVATGVQRKVTFVRVDNPALAGATSDPNVFNIDFSGGMASVVTQMNAALSGSGVTVSNPAGNTLRIMDDGLGTATVNSAGATSTATSVTGSVNLPLFTDGTSPYTDKLGTAGPQSQGYAARITVNGNIIADPSTLIRYQSGVAAADATRPNFIYNQMASASLAYSPTAGIGSTLAPFSGTPSSYLSQLIAMQGEAAGNATQLQQGQDVVLSSLQQRFTDGSSVNIDQEMANLLNLQNSYAANARVMSAVKDMLSQLLQL